MPQPPPLEGWESGDFVENRQGRLSAAQTRALGRRMDGYLVECLIFSAVWLGSGGWLLGAILARPAAGFGLVWWIGGIPLVAFCLLIAVLGPARTLRLQGEIKAGRVAVARGPVERIYMTPQLRYGWVTVGKVKVGCWGAMWQRSWKVALAYLRARAQAREPVNAYYLPASRLFVAAEPE